VFDRSEGRLCSLTEYATPPEALQARFDAEKRHRRHPVIEVVVLTAPTEAHLRRTHARYFQNVGQMASNGLNRVNELRRAAGQGKARSAR
jgi:hypothetical protein